MLDDLRNSAGNPFLDEEAYSQEESSTQTHEHNFLGMTPVQRFVVSVFLFMMILILGGFLLILFQKVFPPI